MLAGAQPLRDVFQPYDRRNIQRTRHNSGMRCPATHVRSESEDQLTIQRRRIGGGDIMRHHDLRQIDGTQCFG